MSTFSRRACQFYAATCVTTLSTNCRNRELRAAATKLLMHSDRLAPHH